MWPSLVIWTIPDLAQWSPCLVSAMLRTLLLCLMVGNLGTACYVGLCRHEPAPDGVVALIVEEFIVFMNSRPGFMLDSGSEVVVFYTCLTSSLSAALAHRC